MNLRHWLGASCLTIAMVSLAGCGGGKVGARVEGTVSYAGEPIEDGAIVFHLPDTKGEGEVGGSRISAGKYLIENNPKITAGRYKVEITGNKSSGKKAKNADPDVTGSDVRQYIPPKYNKQSTLTVELTGGLNKKDFNLEK